MKRRFLSLIFLAVSVIFCSCKFNSLFNENASISISLPFGNSRVGDSVKYSFVVDCFEGAEVSESPKYTQKSESGKVINFNNVTPGTYTVRVLAYEFEDFDNLLYEGHETKNVVEDSVTKFVIMMKKVESKGDVMNTMILAKNKVWMQIQETEVDLNYTAITDGAKAINYYWYLNDLYLEEFTSKNELLISEDFVTKHQLCDTNTYTVVAEFEDGTFDSFTFNYYMNLYGLDKFGNYNDLFNEYLKRQKVFTEYSNDIINTTGYSNTGKPGLDYQLALNIYSNFEIKAANIQLFKDSEHKNKTDQVLSMKVNKETSFKEQDLYTLYYSTEDIEPGFYYAVVKVEYSDSIPRDTYNSYFSDMIYIGEKLHTYKNVRDTLCFKLPESGQSSGLIETAFVNPKFNLTLNALEEIQTEKYDIAIEAYFGKDKEKQLEVSRYSNYINCIGIFEINLSEINTFPENYPLCLDICVKDISNPDNFAHTILQTTSYSIDIPDPSNYVFTINQDVFANERITLPEIEAETNFNVGDVILKDGTLIRYEDVESQKDNIKDKAVAVIFRAKTETAPALGVGLQQTECAWCTTDASAYNVDIQATRCMQDSTNPSSFDGLEDGGWAIDNIVDYLKNNGYAEDLSSSLQNNYPAFYYASSYGTSNAFTGDYQSGWYLPTVAELYELYVSKTMVNAVLEWCGGDIIQDENYLSATQDSTSIKCASTLSFDESLGGAGGVWAADKDTDKSVLVIRKFE